MKATVFLTMQDRVEHSIHSKFSEENHISAGLGNPAMKAILNYSIKHIKVNSQTRITFLQGWENLVRWT
jgi:hypothetical protein